MISSHTKNITDTKLNLNSIMLCKFSAIDLLLPLLDA